MVKGKVLIVEGSRLNMARAREAREIAEQARELWETSQWGMKRTGI